MDLWNVFFFVCRLISVIIIMTIFTICCFMMPRSTMPFGIFARIVLYLIGFQVAPHVGTPDPTAKMLISNHPGGHTDGLTWISALPDNVGFVARSDGFIIASKIIHAFNNHRKCVLVRKAEKENTVQRMKDFLQENPDNKLMIAAEGGIASLCGVNPKAELFEFRTGGFRVADRVQPILIRSRDPIPDMPVHVKDYIPFMWRHRDDPPKTLYVEYLPAVDREKDESPEDFCKRVRKIMQDHANA